MLLKKRKTEEFHFTPEQEACLAKCRELTNDELRILNGGEMLSKMMLITIPQLYIHCAGWNSPWSVGFGVPVAAIVFWIYKGKLVESEKKNEEGIISAEKSEPAPKLSVSDITNENSPWGI